MATQNEPGIVNANKNTSDVRLDEDRSPQESQFVGATLEISGSQKQDAVHPPDVEFSGPGLNRNRPGSTIGRQSVRSTSSRTSMKVNGFKSAQMSEKFFCYKYNSVPTDESVSDIKDNAFEQAVKQCTDAFLKADLDGAVTGSWLLSEIDHWDNEREKVVVLTANSLLVFRFNFITKTIVESRRVSLHIVDTVMIGDFRYPDWSVMPVVSSDRQHGGIQIRWNKGEQPSFGQRWNPWCITIPWITFCHHPLIYNPKESETVTYNVDDFYESLIHNISQAYSRKRPGEKVTVIEGPIMMESYASLSSLVFNQSGVGYYKDRNGMCF